jgi:hypothetical protein
MPHALLHYISGALESMFPSHHMLCYMFKGSNPESTIYCLVDHPSSAIPVSVVLGDSISSHHLSVYVSCRLMGDTLRPSFNGSLPIDFNTLSRRGI